MARIRRWKEKLLLVWFTLFTAFVWARPRSRTPEARIGAARSLVVTGNSGKRAWGVALSTSRPYLHALSASAVPIALPAAVGAFAASAVATADLAAVAASGGSCGGGGGPCYTSLAPPCSLTTATCCHSYPTCTMFTADGGCASNCYSIETCSYGSWPTMCRTCGHNTCGWTCS